MDAKRIFDELKNAVIELDEAKAEIYAKELVNKEIDLIEGIEKGLSEGMKIIGNQFDSGKCYLPELIRATDAFNKAMQIIEPEIKKQGKSQTKHGVIILGTVKGDLHNIGKDILGMLMKVRGFEVHNLGVDVPMSKFFNKAEECQANIIAMSSLLTTTMPSQKEMIDFLIEKKVRDKYITLVGGAPVTESWASKIGADGYAETAEQAVKLAIELVNDRK